ncbi:hypothetical protein H0H92_012529, partial [Tricholoma furcatifolium]
MSATNCARTYLDTWINATEPPSTEWQFTSTNLDAEHVYDGFVLLSLLEDCLERKANLQVPHSGSQSNRFTAAVQARNARIRLYGQPEIRHLCAKCVRIYRDENGKIDKVTWAVVTDGVTVGRPCCGVHNCHKSLMSNRHRFCPDHESLSLVCAIVGCDRAVQSGSKACDTKEHQEIKQVHVERGQAAFQLKERLLRAQRATGSNSDGSDEEDATFDVVDEHVNSSSGDQDKGKKKVRAQFGRKRSHNEQLIVAPC